MASSLEWRHEGIPRGEQREGCQLPPKDRASVASLEASSQRVSTTKLFCPAGTMSGRLVSRSNTSSRLNHANTVSSSAQTPGWPHGPSVTRANSLKRPRTPSGLEFSSCGSPSEQSDHPSSPRLPVRKICMGRPYDAKCVETSHLANHPKVSRRPAGRGSPHCLLCTDRPSGPCSPTFLDQLIKGINYLDRSTNAFYTTCPKSSLSLPRLAANYLERAANPIHLDQPDHSLRHSYSHPISSVAAFDNYANTSIVPSSRGVSALQYVDGSASTSCSRRIQSQTLTPESPQRPGMKLPELPLFGNGIFSLGRLPKFWEAIRSGWSAPEPISKPCSWW
ncbi:uncharacterized protein LOC100468079 isoform X1 [Ailuropoda melanoleuca]|uniref:uncharacterized protein LOC100468079 isoform X1 n=1 Tax=Ailuropoda melanoleuca TaxID=9646 RepID=UPI00059AEDD4|nr:uncharacterized protein LOC100468079 isoform X1 [Ailuropoda melanoleuca]